MGLGGSVIESGMAPTRVVSALRKCDGPHRSPKSGHGWPGCAHANPYRCAPGPTVDACARRTNQFGKRPGPRTSWSPCGLPGLRLRIGRIGGRFALPRETGRGVSKNGALLPEPTILLAKSVELGPVVAAQAIGAVADAALGLLIPVADGLSRLLKHISQLMGVPPARSSSTICSRKWGRIPRNTWANAWS